MSDYIDDAFRVEQTRWKTWRSFDTEGNGIITALNEELCVNATRFYLKGKQDGWGNATITYDGTVGGKL
jgi:hypothetical protein